MKALECENCGSNDLELINGFWVCRYCGTKYIPDQKELSEQRSEPVRREQIKADLNEQKRAAYIRAHSRQSGEYGSSKGDLFPKIEHCKEVQEELPEAWNTQDLQLQDAKLKEPCEHDIYQQKETMTARITGLAALIIFAAIVIFLIVTSIPKDNRSNGPKTRNSATVTVQATKTP